MLVLIKHGDTPELPFRRGDLSPLIHETTLYQQDNELNRPSGAHWAQGPSFVEGHGTVAPDTTCDLGPFYGVA